MMIICIKLLMALWAWITHFDVSKFSAFEKDYFFLENYYCVLTLADIVADSFLCETDDFFPNISIVFCSLLLLQATPLHVPCSHHEKWLICHSLFCSDPQ